MPSTVAAGFTVKSGWAALVVLGGTARSPSLAACRRVELSDPAAPEQRQPYHAAFGTARRAGRGLTNLVAAVERFGRASVAREFQQIEAGGVQLRGVGVVAGSLIDPDRIANDHIRIHALEGRLFRGIVLDAAERQGATCVVWRDRELLAIGSRALALTEPDLRVWLSSFGRSADGPWRAEQKLAALAAWLVLTGRPPRSSAAA